jgi:hypothetical protein
MITLYVDYSNFFKSNFNFNLKFINEYYTFPMWGYGLILYLFNNKLSIIIFQQLLTIITLILVDQRIKSYKVENILVTFRILLIISIHWYFFHTSLWPYSINSNLLILGTLTLSNFLDKQKTASIIFSALIFGILLNFRSDYYYYTIIIIIILVYNLYKNKTILNKNKFLFNIVLFATIIQILMFPWGVYTYKRTGHYLQTSTNAGHVFYISLGQLPKNKWGITPKDEDSSMKSLLQHYTGKSKVNTLTYDSDKFLMKTWKNFVLEDPLEYTKKCIFNYIRLSSMPFYPGSLEKNFSNEIEIDKVKVKIKYYYDNLKYKNLLNYFILGDAKFYMVTFFINLIGIFIFFYFMVLNSMFLFNKISYEIFNNTLFVFSNSIVMYQIFMCVFVFHMPIYNTNVIIFYLISISFLSFYYKKKINYDKYAK